MRILLSLLSMWLNLKNNIWMNMLVIFCIIVISRNSTEFRKIDINMESDGEHFRKFFNN